MNTNEPGPGNLMTIRRKPRKPYKDRHALLRESPGAIVPAPRQKNPPRNADPESVIQGLTNGFLRQLCMFNYRIHAWIYALARAMGKQIAGWPDNTFMIPIKGTPYCLAGPMELKRVGKELDPEQCRVADQINTQRFDKFEDVERYINNGRMLADLIAKLLQRERNERS